MNWLLNWGLASRAVIFSLSATSIWCLLSEFHGLCSMRMFTLAIFLPASIVLAVLTCWAAVSGQPGGRRVAGLVALGASAGLLAAVAYDIFRIPFVFSKELGLEGVVPHLRLFKVFPRFGAMILGQPIEQGHYSLAAQIIGWTYHFSNGLTFGVMYVALVGDPRKHWLWAVLMALILELWMVLSPYPEVFQIHLTATFVAVTMAAHLIFGVALGFSCRRLPIPWSRGSWTAQPVTG